MSSKIKHAAVFTISITIVALVAHYAPWLGIGAGLVGVGLAAWNDDWYLMVFAVPGMAYWAFAVFYPWPMVAISAVLLATTQYRAATMPEPPLGIMHL